jgi:hypothetical protein
MEPRVIIEKKRSLFKKKEQEEQEEQEQEKRKKERKKERKEINRTPLPTPAHRVDSELFWTTLRAPGNAIQALQPFQYNALSFKNSHQVWCPEMNFFFFLHVNH